MGKQLKLAHWLYNNGDTSLTAIGISYYSKLGLRRTKTLINSLNKGA